jgi:F-type H+-transporting ATPase subunit delta
MTDRMRGASAESLAQARERIEPLLAREPGLLSRLVGAETPDASTVGEELFAVTRLLDSSAALRRALTDPNSDGESKAGLVGRLLDGKVSGATVDVVSGLARSRWSSSRDLADACEELGVQATLAGAERDGVLEQVEDELFRFGRIVAGDRELRAALTDRTAPQESRTGLITRLLEGRATPATLVLAREVVGSPRGRRLEQALDDTGQAIAARRDRSVARVVSALPLTEDQRTRLSEALGRVYGRSMHLDVDVDPSLVGGLRIQVGDEVIDASVVARLARAERQLAGQ